MTPEQLTAIKERMPKRDDIVDWSAAQTMILEDIPALVAEVERLQAEAKAMFHAGYVACKKDQRKLYDKIGDPHKEVERLKSENNSLKRSLAFVADSRESNRDWAIAHNALAVWGRAE